ncbi:hypothetical protein CLU85_2352 [Acidovorax sp. 69]|uniref:hypothetical protein n=1 Tax=Acidovorax sp. 69 TaxID=2035202 RepID=UPI000C239035|nr:hypothetical protein [Acidovorax sp. 69]PJI97560.1 hypothetical protein CLU85_2352 [Acidovorax sp. 69]
MSAPHTFAPEKLPADCWDWITREDATRHVLAAFEMARRECFPPTGERFRDGEGRAWSGRETFANDLADCFAMRIKAMAHGYGLGDFAPEAKRLTLWGQRGNACAPAQEEPAP